MQARLLLSLVAVTLAVPGFTSFDLALVPSAGQVRRYDPDANINLGGFNVPNTNNVTLDQANNRLFVSDTAGNWIRAYNYNTGAALGAWNIGGQVAQMSYHAGTNSLFVATTAGSLARLAVSTGSTNSVALPVGLAARTVAVSATSVSVMGTTSSSGLSYAAFDPVSLSLNDSITIGVAALPGAPIGKALLSPGVVNSLELRFVYRDPSGSLGLYRANTALNGFLNTNPVPTLLSGFSTAVLPSITRGHNGYFIIGSDASLANTMRIEEYSSGGALLRQNLVSGYALSGSNFGADNVVAPEPGTMIALSAGLAALVRRRRSRK